jgi:polyphosphate kinase
VLEPALQNRLKQILEKQLADDVKGCRMQSDGTYRRLPTTDSPRLRSQETLYELLADG